MSSVRVARVRCMEVGETRRRGFPVGPLCVCVCHAQVCLPLRKTPHPSAEVNRKNGVNGHISREQEARGTPSMWSTEALVSMGDVSKVQNVCRVVPPCDDQGRFAELVFDDGEEQFAL